VSASASDSVPNPELDLSSDFSRFMNANIGIKNPAKGAKPSALHPPTFVITSQLEALMHNDYPEEDCGVMTAYRFAMPGDVEDLIVGGSQTHVCDWSSKDQWLTKERFIEMVKEYPYNTLVGLANWELISPLKFVAEHDCEQDIRIQSIVNGESRASTFTFYVSKVSVGPYKDCWMTTGVRARS